MRYRLIVSDLDGTLLDDDGSISDETVRLVDEYHARGGLFTIATGRLDESTRIYSEPLGVKIPVITFNGARIVDLSDGRILHEDFLNNGQAKEAYLALREKNKDVIIYSGSERYAAASTPVIEQYARRVRKGVKYIDGTRGIDEIIHEGAKIEKLLIIDPRREDDMIMNMLKRIFNIRFNGIKSDDEYFEVLPPNTSKGSALTLLTGILGIPLSETIAIGDHLNDLEMIKVAGLGVAVENAIFDVVNAADYITASNNEGGVAEVIKKALFDGF